MNEIVAVAHVSTRLFAKSQATLYVDGKPQQNGLLRFPHTEQLTSALVGTSAPPSVGGAHAGGDAWHHAAALGPGMRAVTVPVSAKTGVAGFVFPGDRVDLSRPRPLSPSVGSLELLVDESRPPN